MNCRYTGCVSKTQLISIYEKVNADNLVEVWYTVFWKHMQGRVKENSLFSAKGK